jgi:Tol biopolymer transport system component
LFSKSCGAGAETEICIMHYPDGEIEILDRIWGRVQEINWSPNSRYIVYAKEGNIWRYDIEAKKKKQLTTQGGIFSPFYLSDDTKILYFRDSNLWIMNSDGNNQKLLFSKIIGLPLCSRDGTMFAVKDKDDIWIYVRNKKIHIFHDPHYITEICWSPDSKRIIFISGYQIDTNKDGKITDEDEHFVDLKVIDLKTKKVKTILKGKKSLKNLSFSPYDSKMIFEMEGYIWISNYRKGYKMKKITKGEVPQWISDSEILYLNENSLYYKHIEMNQGMRLTIAHGESPVWFKDSKRVAVKDKGKYWSINLDRLEIEQINKLPTTKRKMRGKEIIVFTKKSKDSYREDYTTEEIWVKNIDGSNPRMVKSAWNNW